MKKMINLEWGQEGKMVSFKRFEGQIKTILSITILSFLACSCKMEIGYDNVLIELNNKSSEIYLREVDDLRQFFKSKSTEEPEKYRETYNKIVSIEKRVSDYRNLKSFNDKLDFLDELTLEFNKLDKKKQIEFIHKKIERDNQLIFESVVENDLNRALYKMYKNFYNYHHSR